jgi:hypothetical protein
VLSRNHLSIFEVYRKAIEEVKTRKTRLPCVQLAWFSDTFLLYTDDRSISSWGELDHLSRWFLYFLIEEQIPGRGAISFGELYADRGDNIFFGQALIEAYEYGEAQDWMGLVLCPSATEVLERQGLLTGQDSNYAYTTIPYGKRNPRFQKQLPACVVGKWTKYDYKKSYSRTVKTNEITAK